MMCIAIGHCWYGDGLLWRSLELMVHCSWIIVTSIGLLSNAHVLLSSYFPWLCLFLVHPWSLGRHAYFSLTTNFKLLSDQSLNGVQGIQELQVPVSKRRFSNLSSTYTRYTSFRLSMAHDSSVLEEFRGYKTPPKPSRCCFHWPAYNLLWEISRIPDSSRRGNTFLLPSHSPFPHLYAPSLSIGCHVFGDPKEELTQCSNWFISCYVVASISKSGFGSLTYYAVPRETCCISIFFCPKPSKV
jgi:hypothetical protein